MKSIGYIRVSTREQGISGLGIQAQRARINDICSQLGLDMVTIYCEVASGADDNRIEFQKAIAHAKRLDAKIVTAKLDRAARSVLKLKTLLDQGVGFVFGDVPESQGASGTLHLTMLAAVGEFERERGRERTREGLAAARARGVRLGAPDGGEALAAWTREHGQGHAVAAIQAQADKRAKLHLDALRDALSEGLSHRAIAARFNAEGVATARGGRWSGVQVGRTITRLGLAVA